MDKLKEIRIFLASSVELQSVRKDFADFIENFRNAMRKHGIDLKLERWEDVDPSESARPKQEEYLDKLRDSHHCVVLYDTKIGPYTRLEMETARSLFRSQGQPIPYIAFRKEPTEPFKSAELEALYNEVYEESGYFIETFTSSESLCLRFVQALLFHLKDWNIKLEVHNSKVMLGDALVAHFENLPFVSANGHYARMREEIQASERKIAKLDKMLAEEDDADIRQMRADTFQALLQQRQTLTQYENDIIATSQKLVSITADKMNERLRKAKALFENGQLKEAMELLNDEALHGDAQAALAHLEAANQEIVAAINSYKAKAAMLVVDYGNEQRFDEAEACYAKALQVAHQGNVGGEELQQLLFDYHKFLKDYARYEHIHEVEEELLRHTVQLYGEEHYNTAAAYNNIGLVCDDRGDYDQAIACYERSLSIKRKLLDEEAPEIADSYENIGVAYDNLREYDRALEYYRKALTIREKVFGKAHPETAKTYDNMGNAYDEQGDLEQALKYKLKALEIFEKVLGTEHLDTATSYNNVGVVYGNQGEWDKALEYHLKDLAIREKVLGPAHPSTASTYNNIAVVYTNKQDYSAAHRYFEKALAIYEYILGPTHPYTCDTYCNIGALHLAQGHTDEALPWIRKAAAGGDPKAQRWLEEHGKKQ